MCDCIKLFNEQLASRNTRIKIPISFGANKISSLPPMIVTEKVDERSRMKPVSLLASYCPFCGEKYPE